MGGGGGTREGDLDLFLPVPFFAVVLDFLCQQISFMLVPLEDVDTANTSAPFKAGAEIVMGLSCTFGTSFLFGVCETTECCFFSVLIAVVGDTRVEASVAGSSDAMFMV